MADDSSKSGPSISRIQSNAPISIAPRQQSASNPNLPPPSANSLPTSLSQSTAGSHSRQAGIVDAIKTIRPQDFTEVHKKPCVRDALLAGISAGFVVGGGRAALIGGRSSLDRLRAQKLMNHKGPVFRTCSYAVTTFTLISAGAYEFCQRKRMLEMAGIRRANEIMEQKKIELEGKKEAERKRRRALKEEQDRQREEEEKRQEKGWSLGSIKFW